MRSFLTDAELSNGGLEDVLPAYPSRMAFLWTRTSKLTEVWDIVRAARLWSGVAISADATGLCFSVTGFSLAHLNWDGRLELPFGKDVLGEATGAEAAGRDRDAAVFQVQTDADVDRAVRLLRLAYLLVDSRSPRMCG